MNGMDPLVKIRCVVCGKIFIGYMSETIYRVCGNCDEQEKSEKWKSLKHKGA